MKFKEVAKEQSFVVNSVSKSKILDYEKCPRKAYKNERDPVPFQMTKTLEPGMLAREFANHRVCTLKGKEYDISTIENKFSLEAIYQVRNDFFNRINFDRLFDGQQIISVGKNISVPIEELFSGFTLNCKPNVLTLTEVQDYSHMNIFEWKTDFAPMSTGKTDAIILAYAIYKKYGLPVNFVRVNLKTGKIVREHFSVPQLVEIETSVLHLFARYVEDMESEVIPEFSPDSHCLYCPFVGSCTSGTNTVNSLTGKLKTSIWAKNYAKRLEDEVKAAAKEVLTNTENDSIEINADGEMVLLPFTNGKYGATTSTSVSYQMAKRGIKKQELVSMLLENEDFRTQFAEQVDIKFNQGISNYISDELDIPMKEVTRTSVSLKINEAFEEDEVDEEEDMA